MGTKFKNAHGSSNTEMGFRLTGIPEISITDVHFNYISYDEKEDKIL